ncbi:MAG: VCBS domain-containing protein, partial [Pirellula sp.]
VNGAVTEDASTPTLTDSGSVTFAEVDDTDVLTSSVVLATTATTGPAIPSGLSTALASALSLTQTGTNDGTITWDFSLANSLTQYLAAGETVTAVYTITVADDSGTANNTATRDVTVVVTGTNDTPTITVVDVNGAVTEDASTPTLTDSGSVTFAEIDDTDILTSSVALANTSTTGPTIPSGLATALASALSLTQTGTNDGTITWDFSLANSLTQYLAAGETVTAVYTITVADDSGTANNTATRDVTVVVTGTNDTPTITVVDVNGAVTEDASTPTLTDSGSVTFAEIDDTDILTSSVALSNTSTTGPAIPSGLATALSNALNLTQTGTNDGSIAWNFSLANSLTQYLAAGETVTATYTITLSDDSGTGTSTATQDVTVVITGTNDDPVITIGGSDSAAEIIVVTGTTLTTGGTLSVEDIDLTDIVTATVSNFTKSGNFTGLTLSDAQLEAMLSINASVISNAQQSGSINWAFDSAGFTFGYLAAGESITMTYTITVTDSQGATDTQDVVVTINGDNTAPDITVETGDSASEGFIETDSTLTTNGTLSVLDINTTDTVTAQVSSVVASGTTAGLLSNNTALLNMLSINTNVINNTSETGTITWVFDSGSEVFDYLALGETLILTYTITATDSQNTTDTQEITITITGTNDEQGNAINTGVTIAENATNTVITSSMLQTVDLDQSANDLTYTVTSSTTTGVLRRAGVALTVHDVFTQADIDSGIITYDHDGSETFIDSFSYTVDDGFGILDVDSFQITINPVNDMTPVIISNGGGSITNISIQENTTSVTTVLATDADLPVQTMVYQIVGGADAGLFQVDSSTGALRFVLSRNYENPTDLDRDNVYEVLVRATDGLLSDTQLVRVNVLDVNEVPVANNNSYQTSFIDDLIVSGTGILANDFDPDGDALSTVLVSGPVRGTLLDFLPNGSFRYRPEAGFQGTVTLSYLVTDGLLQSNVAMITVVVVLPDNVPSTPNNSSTNTNTTVTSPTLPVVGPVVAPATPTESPVDPSVAQPVAMVSSERVDSQTQAVPAAGPELVKGELKEGVLVVSLMSSTSFDKFEVDQTRYEYFESQYERFKEDTSGLEYRSVERRDRGSQEASEVQFNTDSALV